MSLWAQITQLNGTSSFPVTWVQFWNPSDKKRVQFWKVMIWTSLLAQFCVTTCYVMDCDWYGCVNEPCGNTPLPITTLWWVVTQSYTKNSVHITLFKPIHPKNGTLLKPAEKKNNAYIQKKWCIFLTHSAKKQYNYENPLKKIKEKSLL